MQQNCKRCSSQLNGIPNSGDESQDVEIRETKPEAKDEATANALLKTYCVICHGADRPKADAGLAAARARGKVGGRKPMSPTAPQVVLAKKLYDDKSVMIEDICTPLQISKSSLYRYLKMDSPRELKCRQTHR